MKNKNVTKVRFENPFLDGFLFASGCLLTLSIFIVIQKFCDIVLNLMGF